MSPSTLSAFLAVSLVLVLAAEAQQTPSCAQSLVPCYDYINSTSKSPPSSCCEPLKEAINTQLTCLCNLYNTPGLLKSFGININDALLLPSRCKLAGDLDSCVKVSSPASSPQSPPASPGKDKSGANRIAGIGMLGVLLFWAYVELI